MVQLFVPYQVTLCFELSDYQYYNLNMNQSGLDFSSVFI